MKTFNDFFSPIHLCWWKLFTSLIFLCFIQLFIQFCSFYFQYDHIIILSSFYYCQNMSKEKIDVLIYYVEWSESIELKWTDGIDKVFFCLKCQWYFFCRELFLEIYNTNWNKFKPHLISWKTICEIVGNEIMRLKSCWTEQHRWHT